MPETMMYLFTRIIIDNPVHSLYYFFGLNRLDMVVKLLLFQTIYSLSSIKKKQETLSLKKADVTYQFSKIELNVSTCLTLLA